MEHFLLPQDPSSSPVKVPYVCQEPYDGGPFLEYPIRKKKSWLLPDTENPRFMPYRLREVLHPTPTREQEAFLQTWLFFGLLHTLQGETFDAEDYIVTATSNPKLRYISTSKMLPNLDDARRRRTIPATDADKKKQLEQVSQYLKVAMNAGINGPQVGGFFYNFYNEEIRAEMRRNGWCPCDIARVVDKFQHFQTLYFVSKMKRIDSVLDHERCTSELCALYQTDREAYRTKHCQQGCNCPDASINPATVSAILRRGNIPLLRIVELKGRAGEVCVEVVESTTDTPYVPISHVWKDGMGNPNSNALPQCQLRHVSRLVNLLKTGLFAEPTSEPLLFWIDTLCCPVEPLDDKLLAISMLHKTYVEATAVLVMDAGLQLCDHREIHGVETLARLYTSGWMHRLWTLQEGGLAKRLFFQFKHEAIDLEQQYRELQATMPSDVRFLGPYMGK
ncbi:MAG: hypothetical protein M1818_006396 [Claussenomyces sp. TS43310]|nr:MAG: hypothetical protein M1818_006396 [Claussenomyces sp. TS43310]